MTTLAAAQAAVLQLDAAADALIDLASRLWDEAAARGALKLAELVLVTKQDAIGYIEDGDYARALGVASNALAAANDVLKSEAPYTVDGVFRYVIEESILVVQDGLKKSTGPLTLLAIGALVGLYLSRR
jgi:hypothetical protein